MQLKHRLLLLALAFLAAVATLPVIAGYWLLYTEPGLRRLVAIAENLSVVDLKFEDIRGTVAGSLTAQRVIVDHKRIRIVIDDLATDLDPSGAMLQTIKLDYLRIGRVDVTVKPRTEPPDTSAPDFLPRWLAIGADEVSVDELLVRLDSGTVLRFKPVRADVSVSQRKVVARDAVVDAGVWSATGAATLISAYPLRLATDASFKVPAAELEGRVTGEGDLEELGVRLALEQPFAAQLEGRLLGLDTQFAWDLAGTLDAFDVRRFVASAPIASLRGPVRTRGTIPEFSLDGTLEADDGAAGPVQLALNLGYAEERLTVTAGRLTITDSALTLTTKGGVTFTDPLTFAFEGDWDGLRWPLDGAAQVRSASGQYTVTGGEAIDFSVIGTVATPGLPVLAVNATGKVAENRLTLRPVVVGGFGGRLDLDGELALDDTLAWRVSARGRDLNPATIRRDLTGRISMRVSASGAGFDPASPWQARIESLDGTFRGRSVRGRGAVARLPAGFRFDGLDVNIAGAQLTADGTTGRDGELFAELNAPDLSQLLPELRGRLRGEFRARARDPWNDRRPTYGVQANLSGRDLEYGDYRVSALGLDADVDLADRETSWVRLRLSGVRSGERNITSVRLSLDGYAKDHQLVLRAGAGENAVDLLGRGALAWPRYTTTLQEFAARGPDLPSYSLESPATLAVEPGNAALSQACFRRDQSRICADGNWSTTAPWTLRFRVADLPLAALAAGLPNQPAYSGQFDLEGSIAGAPGQAWTGRARARLDNASLGHRRANGKLEQLRLGDITLDALATAEQFDARVEGQATATTSLLAVARSPRIAGTPFASLPIEGSVEATTRELTLLPLFVPEIDRAAGLLRANLTIRGTVGAPLVNGRVVLEDGSLDFYQTNLRLTKLAATLQFIDDALLLDASASAGEGSMTAKGRLAWSQELLEGQLALKGDRLLVANVPEARVLASPDLDFRFKGREIDVTGTVRVPWARIEPADITGAVLASADERLVGVDEVPPEQRSRVRSSLRLTLGDDVRLKALGLSGKLEGSVITVLAPDAVATGSGEFKIEDGRYKAYGQDLEVERGRLLFAGGPLTDPGVDLRASKRVPGYTAGVIARGRLRQPELTLFSDPPLPQSQIASLLIVGRTLDSLQDQDRSTLGGSSNALLASGGALLAGQLGRYAGIEFDELGVETDDANESSLVIGKFLNPNLYVSYGVSLTDTINTLKLRYTIGDRWTIKTESGAAQSVDVEYRIDR